MGQIRHLEGVLVEVKESVKAVVKLTELMMIVLSEDLVPLCYKIGHVNM